MLNREIKKEKIGLIQIDGTEPNLALMKLSKFYKDQGKEIILIDLSTLGINKWIASKIFIGGSGYNLGENLPTEIEELVPDYELYNIDYSMGFTTRGCIKHCDFCIVQQKEGSLIEVNMNWIKHNKVMVMDNNFLASPLWKEKLIYFINGKMKVSINQALDITLINEDNIKLLKKLKSYDMKFKKIRYYFAFDHIELKDIVEKNIKLMIEHGFNTKWLMFYILTGFDTTHQQDLERINLLIKYNCLPYIMKYNNKLNDKWLNNLDRWINRGYYRFIPYEEYNKGALVKYF